MIITSILAGAPFSVHAQKRPQDTSSARAAYGNAEPEFKANKNRNHKAKKKARKSAKRKKAKDTKASYFKGRPY